MTAIVMDLDGTLTIEDSSLAYEDILPNMPVVLRVREYKRQGFSIIISTARQMRTYENSVGKINANTLPVIIAWLDKHNIPYDEIYVGKPWPGHEGFYVDDRAVRPDEFARLSHGEILELTGRWHNG